jgi:hypothetical protein
LLLQDFESAKDGEPIARGHVSSFLIQSSGETFTMEDTEGARGVNHMILEELFRVIIDRHYLFHYDITVSVLEVYK